MIKIGGTVRHKSRIDGSKYQYCYVLRIESSDVIESYRSIISTESERFQNNFKDQQHWYFNLLTQIHTPFSMPFSWEKII